MSEEDFIYAWLLAAKHADFGRAIGAAVAKREAAAATDVECVFGVLAVGRRNHEAVFVIGNRHHVVHLFHLGHRQARLLQDGPQAAAQAHALGDLGAALQRSLHGRARRFLQVLHQRRRLLLRRLRRR